MLSIQANASINAIHPYLFTAPDASTHIFDFLSDPLYHGSHGWDTSDGQVTNWTEYCSSPAGVFIGYGPFLGCLLYPNTTRNIRDGTLPSNLTDVGFTTSNQTADTTSRYLRSLVPMCLSAYCASQSDCAATSACDFGNLLTDGHELSAQGVGNCWSTMCSSGLQLVNPDIAGVGVCIVSLIDSGPTTLRLIQDFSRPCLDSIVIPPSKHHCFSRPKQLDRTGLHSFTSLPQNDNYFKRIRLVQSLRKQAGSSPAPLGNH